MLKVVRGPINHARRAKTLMHFGHQLFGQGNNEGAMKCFVDARRSYRMLPETSTPANLNHLIHTVAEKIRHG